ncbi:MAG: 3-hydroxyacyl-CoA dehydrogenase family protein [Terriglobia bacterium]
MRRSHNPAKMHGSQRNRDEGWQVPGKIPAGVLGLGLMGTSIATCLLAAGHPVIGVETASSRRANAHKRILAFLTGLQAEGVLASDPLKLIQRFTVSGSYYALRGSRIVIESVSENIEVKRRVIRKVEEVVDPETIVGSNTSAIPPTELQRGALHPRRILGIHWAEPAHITRFLEVICGKQTAPVYAERALALARRWGKEPSLLRKDVRGFITNRIMYAMLREAFHLVQSGVASIEDVDRSLRNDLGYWITFAGPFRFMDLTGIPAYEAVMRDLLPDLSNDARVPLLIRKLVRSGARGVANAKGFYRYTPAQARRWQTLFLQFSYDIRTLALKYSATAESRTAIKSQHRLSNAT